MIPFNRASVGALIYALLVGRQSERCFVFCLCSLDLLHTMDDERLLSRIDAETVHLHDIAMHDRRRM